MKQLLGVGVDYLVREDNFYHIFCSEQISRIIEDRFRHFGINLVMGRGVQSLHKHDTGRVAAVVDTQGDSYECDLVVRAIGVDPRIEFLQDSGIETATGVVVDPSMRNAAEDVWAAGDCAQVKFPGVDRAIIQKLWYTAQPQGWIAGENMAGGNARYELPPMYQAAMFMDLDFTSYGQMPAPWNDYEQQTVCAPNDEDALMVVHDGSQVVGCSFLGRALTKEDLEYIVQTGMKPGEALERAERVFGARRKDRAPLPRIAPRRRLSRRPYFWPFGTKKTWRN